VFIQGLCLWFARYDSNKFTKPMLEAAVAVRDLETTTKLLLVYLGLRYDIYRG